MSSAPDIAFPFAQYTSLLGVHSALLLFAGLYLPRTTQFIAPLPSQASSRDRPQHAFLQPLTADPVLTLGWLCAGAAVLQAWWAGYMRMWYRDVERSRAAGFEGTAGEADEVQKRIENSETIVQKLSLLKDALKATLASSAVFHFVLVLFGAPITSHFTQTYLFAFLLSVLVVYPSVYTLRTPSFAPDTASLVHRLTWTRLFAEISTRSTSERALVYPAFGSCLGAWLGAIPLALDWDRPWQAWPLAPAYGAILGYILSSVLALLVSGTYFLADADVRSRSSTSISGSARSGEREKSRRDRKKTR